MRRKIVFVIVCVLSVTVLIYGFVFYRTGGNGLLRIIRPYLMASVEDKRYSWGDFSGIGVDKKMSGFYSEFFSNQDRMAIWTLTGIRFFYHKPATSIYYFRDTCEVVKQLNQNKNTTGETKLANPEQYYFTLSSWQELVKDENLVTVQWVSEHGRHYIDKAWSQSGKYRVLGKIEGGVCE